MLHMQRLLMPSKGYWQRQMAAKESKSGGQQEYCVQNGTSELREAMRKAPSLN
jgi:hypothetical protein